MKEIKSSGLLLYVNNQQNKASSGTDSGKCQNLSVMLVDICHVCQEAGVARN